MGVDFVDVVDVVGRGVRVLDIPELPMHARL